MKFSVILSNLGRCSDRYVADGYGPDVGLKEQFERFSQLDGADGVELVGTWHINEENIAYLLSETKRLNKPVVSIIPDHFGTAKWGKGAFTSPDKAIRKEAASHTLSICEYAKRLDCPTVSIWNGQDGYDYPLQANYIDTNNWLVEGIKEAAAQYPELNIALEYKPKEPRNHCFISNVYAGMFLAEKTGLKNVGVTVDFGHSLEAYENVSEAVCLASKYDRLMHLHINDNFRTWDDDLITGSVHTIEYIELFYWLKKLNYQGYLSIDQYPYRENALDAAQESLNWMKCFQKAANRIDEAEMQKILSRQDAVASTRYIRELLFD